MKTALPLRISVAALIPVLALASCSTTATIERLDGPATEGRIDRSDPNTLYVSDPNGRIMPIERRQVADIDHPGNVALGVGGFLAATFLLALASAVADERTRVNLPAAAAFLGPCLALTGGGGYFYFRSRSAAAAFEEVPKVRYIRLGPKKPTFEAEDFRMPLPPAPAPPDGGAEHG